MERMIHETVGVKIASVISGILGSLSISMFWVPKRLKERGGFIAGAIISGISSISALLLTGFVIKLLGYNEGDMDATLSIGYVIGLISVALVGMIANFFREHEEDSIDTVIDEIKHKEEK